MSVTDAPPIEGQQTIDGDEVQVDPHGPPLDTIVVDGTVQLGLREVGGKAPLGATISLSGAKADIETGRTFDKGQVLVFQVAAVVDGVAQKDKTDKKTGLVMECAERVSARVTDMRLIDHS